MLQSTTVKSTVFGIILTTTGLALTLATSTAKANELPPPVSEADFPIHSAEKVMLGKMLFYDKILSGNRNISCATCHHSMVWSTDGLSLPVGEGGRGLGMTRDTGSDEDAIVERVPRNAPQVFNLGAYEFTTMFHDGRVTEDPSQPSGFNTPVKDDFPLGIESSLAAQALFPPTSPTEMAGQEGENLVANEAAAGDFVALWNLLLERLRKIDEYVTLFQAAYPDDIVNASDITITHVANAIGAYEDVPFRAINSPFDRYLRGERNAMSQKARHGMRLFYGKAGCADCHSGPFQTNHQFHAVGMPQIGPGKGDLGADGNDDGDFGREQVTGDPADRYKFRTPSLRNVPLTGPWGHDGAYNSLEAVVRHMLTDSAIALENYDTAQAVLPSQEKLNAHDFTHHEIPANREAIAEASEIIPVRLSERKVSLLMDFLHALVDPASLDLRNTIPSSVPSGLPLAD